MIYGGPLVVSTPPQTTSITSNIPVYPDVDHSHILRNQVVNLNQRVQFLTRSRLLLYYKAPEQFEKKHLPRTTKSAVCSMRCSIFVN